MGNTVTVKGNGLIDTQTRVDCLQAISNEATTEELKKLKKAMADPSLRGMLQMI